MCESHAAVGIQTPEKVWRPEDIKSCHKYENLTWENYFSNTVLSIEFLFDNLGRIIFFNHFEYNCLYVLLKRRRRRSWFDPNHAKGLTMIIILKMKLCSWEKLLLEWKMILDNFWYSLLLFTSESSHMTEAQGTNPHFRFQTSFNQCTEHLHSSSNNFPIFMKNNNSRFALFFVRNCWKDSWDFLWVCVWLWNLTLV